MKTHILTHTGDQIDTKLDAININDDGNVSSLTIGSQELTEDLIEKLKNIEIAGTTTFGSEGNQ